MLNRANPTIEANADALEEIRRSNVFGSDDVRLRDLVVVLHENKAANHIARMYIAGKLVERRLRLNRAERGKDVRGQIGIGDGGIDGIIQQDALGLTNVYIQAKRYSDSNKVGEPEIRNFIGSLDSRGATLGVFITTSTFQPNAERTANNYRHGKIVLINGIKLTSLMLSYGIGVQKRREFSLYDIDDDFFEDDLA